MLFLVLAEEVAEGVAVGDIHLTVDILALEVARKDTAGSVQAAAVQRVLSPGVILKIL